MKQGDIYWVNLDPTKGSETQKTRSCVIIQSDLLNRGSRTFIIAPFLPDHRSWPFVVNVEASIQNNLDKSRNINLKQLRAVDKVRLIKQQGRLEDHYMKEALEKLKPLFGLDS